ncbi:hypothetical protein VCHA29O37_90197 [Vibrio chagasii]|nr:hypothetical protein VCHA29O37_90197 [Vibrio chagasii]
MGQDDEACGEIEIHHPGNLGSQDAFYVRNLKCVGRKYLQTFIDIFSKSLLSSTQRKHLWLRLDIVYGRILPFFDTQELQVFRILTDRGTEYCGNVERQYSVLLSGYNDIDHTKKNA